MHFEHLAKSAVFVCVAAYAVRGSGLLPTQSEEEKEVSLFYFFLAVAAAYFAFVELKWSFVRARLPPGSLGIPILGEMLQLISDPTKLVIDRAMACNGFFLTHIFFAPTVMCTDDESMTWLFKQERQGHLDVAWPKHWNKLFGPKAVSESRGEDHKRLRKWLDPAFSIHSIKNYFAVVNETMETFLQHTADEGFVESAVLRKHALRLLFKAVFQRDDEAELDRLNDLLTTWAGGLLTLLPIEAFKWTAFSKAMAARRAIVVDMKKWIQEFKTNERLTNKDDLFLGRLLACQESSGRGDDEVTDTLVGILFAGHDTTYGAVSSILYHLDKHPSVWKALQAEAKTYPRVMDFETLQKAPVLNAIFDETMRCTPPIAGSIREAPVPLTFREFSMPSNFKIGYNVLAGSAACVDPEQFQIERYLPADHPFTKASTWSAVSKKDEPTSIKFRPFGGGARMCMGTQFARLEGRLMFAQLARSYEFEVRNPKLVTTPIGYWAHEFKIVSASK